MMAAMVIGGVVCTALSMAGGFITDLKIGYWTVRLPQKGAVEISGNRCFCRYGGRSNDDPESDLRICR